MPDPIEAVFYIHGVSNDVRGRSHRAQYDTFHSAVGRRNPQWPTTCGGAEWGWNHSAGDPRQDELLTDAQRLLGSRAIPAVEAHNDFTLNPARLVINGFRSLFMYGFGDVFYYVSEDGKASVRQTVSRQIAKFTKKLMGADAERPISLTLIGHSAGSIVAFDLLFYLYFSNPGNKHTFLDTTKTGISKTTLTELDQLKNAAGNGTLRIRRLITFGSPITPLACRSNAVLAILASDKQLDPHDYGLDRNPPAFDKLEGPRWINLWDKDDPIAWPVEPLMKQPADTKIIEDIYTDVSDQTKQAHDAYWTSAKVHKIVAERW
jgi:hypothetical protein